MYEAVVPEIIPQTLNQQILPLIIQHNINAIRQTIQTRLGENAGDMTTIVSQLNLADVDGNTALHHAVTANALQVVQYLLDIGVDANAVNNNGQTALHLAATQGFLPAAKLLVHQQADPNIVDRQGQTPKSYVDKHAIPELFTLLMNVETGQSTHDQLSLRESISLVAPDPDVISRAQESILSILNRMPVDKLTHDSIKAVVENCQHPARYIQAYSYIKTAKGIFKKDQKISVSLEDILTNKAQPDYSVLDKQIESLMALKAQLQQLAQGQHPLKYQFTAMVSSLTSMVDKYQRFKQEFAEGSEPLRRALLGPISIYSLGMDHREVDAAFAHRFKRFFDLEQRPDSDAEYGLHPVVNVDEVWYKASPAFPTNELAVHAFENLLRGFYAHGTAAVEVLLLINRNANAHFIIPTIASKSAEGECLADIYSRNADVLKQIEPYHYSLMVFLSILMRFSDAKLDNFNAAKIREHSYAVTGFDNDYSLRHDIEYRPKVYAWAEESHIVRINSIFLLMEQMEHPVDSAFRAHFCRLSPEMLVAQWLAQLQILDRSYRPLQDKLSQQGDTEFPLMFRLLKGYLPWLYQSIKTMHALLKKDGEVTHKTVFQKIMPLVAKFYETALETEHRDPVEAYRKEVHNLMNTFEKLMKEGRLQLSEEELQLLQQVKDNEDNSTYLSIADACEEFISAIDFLHLTFPEQQELLQYICNNFSGMTNLTLHNAKGLTDDHLIQLSQTNTALAVVELVHCDRIHMHSLLEVLAHHPQLSLTLSYKAGKYSIQDLTVLMTHCQTLQLILPDNKRYALDKQSDELIQSALAMGDMVLLTAVLLHCPSSADLMSMPIAYRILKSIIEKQDIVLLKECISLKLQLDLLFDRKSVLDCLAEMGVATAIAQEMAWLFIVNGVLECQRENTTAVLNLALAHVANDGGNVNNPQRADQQAKLLYFARNHNQLTAENLAQLVSPDSTEVNWGGIDRFRLSLPLVEALLAHAQQLAVLDLSRSSSVNVLQPGVVIAEILNSLTRAGVKKVKLSSEQALAIKKEGDRDLVDLRRIGQLNDLKWQNTLSIELTWFSLELRRFKPGERIDLIDGFSGMLQENTTIREIQFNSELTAREFTTLCQGIQNNRHLETLVLNKAGINAAGARELKLALIHHPTLRHLELQENKLDADAAAHLAELLRLNPRLEKMILFGNPLGDEGAAHFAKALAANTRLRYLDLNQCQLTSIGLNALAEVCQRKNKTLRYLNLGYNSFDDSCFLNWKKVLTLNSNFDLITMFDNREGQGFSKACFLTIIMILRNNSLRQFKQSLLTTARLHYAMTANPALHREQSVALLTSDKEVESSHNLSVYEAPKLSDFPQGFVVNFSKQVPSTLHPRIVNLPGVYTTPAVSDYVLNPVVEENVEFVDVTRGLAPRPF